ncbi:unnamed protein product, partial [Owenia fusiformis]
AKPHSSFANKIRLAIIPKLFITVFIFKVALDIHLESIKFNFDTTSGQENSEYLTVNFEGRLGNLMFEYAGLYGLANTNKKLPYMEIAPVTMKLKKIFNLSVPLMDDDSVNDVQEYHTDQLIWGKYSKQWNSLPKKRNLKIFYWLQSFKFFWHVKSQILQEFQFSSTINEKAVAILRTATMRKSGQPNVTLIGVHVRRGDIMIQSNLRRGYVPAPKRYFQNAMHHFNSSYPNCVFIVCTDDISWTKLHFPVNNNIIFSARSAEIDLAILSKCDHTIISTGTFGWWAAFLA